MGTKLFENDVITVKRYWAGDGTLYQLTGNRAYLTYTKEEILGLLEDIRESISEE